MIIQQGRQMMAALLFSDGFWQFSALFIFVDTSNWMTNFATGIRECYN